MSDRIHYTHCPVCNSTSINPLLRLKDHSVSGELFVVWQCSQCSLRFTQDVPGPDAVGPYYQSDGYISHSNTSRGLINRLYQGVRKFTLKSKAKMVLQQTGKSKGRLLDFGAGTGAFLNEMQKTGWQVKGVEPDAGARSKARQVFGLELQQPEVLQQLPPDSFDAITLWHVLEHVHHLHQTVSLLHRLLKKEGILFVAVPNYTSLDADLYRLNWAAYDVPRHLYHFSPKAIHLLLQQHGLRVIAQKPMWFDAYYISLLSSRYKNGKSNWLGAFITGLRSNTKALAQPGRCSSLIYIIRKA